MGKQNWTLTEQKKKWGLFSLGLLGYATTLVMEMCRSDTSIPACQTATGTLLHQGPCYWHCTGRNHFIFIQERHFLSVQPWHIPNYPPLPYYPLIASYHQAAPALPSGCIGCAGSCTNACNRMASAGTKHGWDKICLTGSNISSFRGNQFTGTQTIGSFKKNNAISCPIPCYSTSEAQNPTLKLFKRSHCVWSISSAYLYCWSLHTEERGGLVGLLCPPQHISIQMQIIFSPFHLFWEYLHKLFLGERKKIP